MSSWSYSLTNKGRQLQAKAQTGAQLVYTRMAVGSGALSGQSLEAMTALITPVKDLTISRLKRPPGTIRALIGAVLKNQDVATGFYLREVGIFATDPDDGEILYMYSNAGTTADYIAPKGDGVIEKAVNMNVFVGAAANITANIDESLVYATQQDLADAIAGITIGDASTTQKGVVQLSNATNSTSETLAATPKAVKSAYDTATAAQNTANAANQAAATAQQTANASLTAGDERKAELVAALVAKGIAATTSETWESLIGKVIALIKATGNATAAQLLSGATASNINGPITGTMPNQGAKIITPSTANQPIAAGYHNGSGYVAGDTDLIAANIRSGINIFGVLGSLVEGKRVHVGSFNSTLGTITVSGIPFKPRTVVIASGINLTGLYSEDLGGVNLYWQYSGSGRSGEQWTGIFTMLNDGFRLRNDSNQTYTCNYMAIE
ncbi:Phage tail fiber repeat protein [compost metagenome]